MSISQFILILWAQKRIFIISLSLIFLSTLIVSLVIPKTYTSSVSAVVDYKGADPLTGAVLPAQLVPGYMATQVDVISSHSVALKVVDKLRLTEFPIVQEQFQSATDGIGSIRDWLADSLLKDLDVQPARDSSVIIIQFSGDNPEYTAAMANAFADAYIQTSLDLKVEPARRQSLWFNEQLKGLRESVELAQQKLSTAQREKGILAADNRLDLETTRLAELSTQLVQAEAQTYDADSRLRQMSEVGLDNRISELPDMVANSMLQTLKTDLARAEGKLAENSGRFDRNHPQYQSIAAEVSSLKSKIALEITTAKGAIYRTAELAKQRESSIRHALDVQKKRILELKQNHDALAVLARDVENAQRDFDTASQRASQVRLESQMDQSNIAVLNHAIPPLKPSKPNIPLNLFLSMFLGSMISAGVAFLFELSDRRVRSRDDLAEWMELPLLAELPDWNYVQTNQAVLPWKEKLPFLKRLT